MGSLDPKQILWREFELEHLRSVLASISPLSLYGDLAQLQISSLCNRSRIHDNAYAVPAVMERPLRFYGPSSLEAEWGNPSCCITGLRALMIHAASVSSETSAREVRRKD